MIKGWDAGIVYIGFGEKARVTMTSENGSPLQPKYLFRGAEFLSIARKCWLIAMPVITCLNMTQKNHVSDCLGTAYGLFGMGLTIPSKADLIYDVEMLEVIPL